MEDYCFAPQTVQLTSTSHLCYRISKILGMGTGLGARGQIEAVITTLQMEKRITSYPIVLKKNKERDLIEVYYDEDDCDVIMRETVKEMEQLRKKRRKRKSDAGFGMKSDV